MKGIQIWFLEKFLHLPLNGDSTGKEKENRRWRRSVGNFPEKHSSTVPLAVGGGISSLTVQQLREEP